jgi:hypothetical protein
MRDDVDELKKRLEELNKMIEDLKRFLVLFCFGFIVFLS